MVLTLSREEVTGTPRAWLASRVRLITDPALLDEAARSSVGWLAAEARNHPLWEGTHDVHQVCPACGSAFSP